MRLSVVIPCLDEEKTLAKVIRAAKTGLANSDLEDSEIVIADNGSKDRSREIAVEEGARVVPVEQRGYGAALHTGIMNAKFEYVIFADADCSYDFEEIPRYVEQAKTGKFDMVVGSRIKGNIHPGAMPFLNRHLGTPVLTWLIRLIFRIPATDCNSGYRLLSKAFYKKLKLNNPGMEYASEMLIRAAILKCRYTEVPISLRPDERDRPPHLRRWRDGWRHLKTILCSAPGLLLYTGVVLFVIFSALSFVLAFGVLDLGFITMDWHWMFGSVVAAVASWNLINVGLLVKYFMHISDFLPSPAIHKGENTLNFETGITVSILIVAVGIVLWGYVFYIWHTNNYSYLFEIRKFLMGMYFILNGVSLAVSSFAAAMMYKSKTHLEGS